MYLIALITLIEEPNGSDGRTMIVERLQKVVSLIDAEHVDQPIPGGTGEQPRRLRRVSGEFGILQAEHFGVVRLDQAQFLQRGEIVDSNIARSIAGRQMFPVRAHSDRSDSVSSVVRCVALFARPGSRQIQIFQVSQLRIYVEHFEQLVAIDVSLVERVVRGDVLLEVPHADGVVAGTGDETASRHTGHGIRSCGIHLDAPDTRRVVEKRMGLADPPDVPHVPHVDAVVVVDAGQFVVPFVERQRDRVRIPRVRRMLRHVTAIDRR